jgi:predicted transcriptional regulator
MIELNTIKAYDKHVKDMIDKAKKEYPGYVKYEITENGSLYLYSLRAYPGIIKKYCDKFVVL